MQFIIQLITRFVPRHIMQRFAMLFLNAISIFYRGKNYHDPISGISYRKMLPYGRQIVRKNALAPNSGSLERHRVIWLFLKNETSFFTAQLNFLHIAPESCFLKPFKQLKNLTYVTGDLESPWADVKLDVRQMPLSDNSFDVTMCNHVFEHIDDDKKAMSEFLRILKPGGWGIFMVPIKWDRKTIEDLSITDPAEREKLFGQRDHVRYYGYDYPDRLREVGFEVTVIDYAQKLGDDLVKKFSLLPDEKIIFCQKPIN